MSKLIRCVYDPTSRSGTVFNREFCRTKASFKDEADINSIMRKYNRTGFLVDPTVAVTRKPFYGDFSSTAGFRELQDRLAAIRQVFDSLPSDFRARLGNDPANLADYIADPANATEAASLGLIKPVSVPEGGQPSPATAGTPPAGSPAPTSPPAGEGTITT